MSSISAPISSSAPIAIECTICLADCPIAERVALTCAHLFHTNCISDWMKIKRDCPVCHTPQPLTGEEEIDPGHQIGYEDFSFEEDGADPLAHEINILDPGQS